MLPWLGKDGLCFDFKSRLISKEGSIFAFPDTSLYDTYILSTAPWRNASAQSDKVEWVQAP